MSANFYGFYEAPAFPCPPIDENAHLRSTSPVVFHQKEIVDDHVRCRQVVHRLKKECIVSVAGEGIRMGAEGPLTLLQIGTFYGQVFIFDVLVNRDLFDKGGLRQFLESDYNVKVVHGSSSLNAALHYQFNVYLRNVFDTQVGHLVIQEHKGRKLPSRITLSDVCQMYSESPHPYDWRSDVKEMWMKKIGDFWGQRPLSEEMMEYAAGDAMAIIPDVYRNQMDYIEENNLLKLFYDLVYEELNVDINIVLKEQKGLRIKGKVLSILEEMESKYNENIQVFEILDQDDLQALTLVPYYHADKLSSLIKRLKTDVILEELTEIENDLRMQQEIIFSRESLDDELRSYEQHDDERVSQKAAEIRQDIYKIILEDIGRRYSGLSDPHILAEIERQALRTIVPKSEMDPDVDPLVLAFHWLVIDFDIDQEFMNLRFGPVNYQLPDSFCEQLTSYTTSLPVSDKLKQKAQLLLNENDKIKNKIEIKPKKKDLHVTIKT